MRTIDTQSVLLMALDTYKQQLSSIHHDSSSASSSSSSTSLTLGSTALSYMQVEYEKHLDEYRGEPWILENGCNVIEAISDYTLALTYESELHSFVLYNTQHLVDHLLMKDGSFEPVANDIKEFNNIQPVHLDNWIAEYILRYKKGWDNIEEIIEEGPKLKNMDTPHKKHIAAKIHHAMTSLWMIYSTHNNTLPDDMSEYWYNSSIWRIFFDMISFKNEELVISLGETMSNASSIRRNKNRVIGDWKKHGHK
jgi:hypothetical protein